MKQVGQEEFRAAMARLASAVTLVTTDGPEGRHGLAATAVSSVTDCPPMLLVCINKGSRSNGLLMSNRVFGVNILNTQQAELAKLFSSSIEAGERFSDEGIWKTLKTGAPILVESLASFDCNVEQVFDIGTHTVFIGRVVAVELGDRRSGLIYFDRSFCNVDAEQPFEVRARPEPPVATMVT